MPDEALLDRIRALLEGDRRWAAYALCDLEPPQAQYGEWRVADTEDALVLLYREFATPVLFAFGSPDAVSRLLADLHEPELYLLIRPEHLPAVAARYAVAAPTEPARQAASMAAGQPAAELLAMWRMILQIEQFAAATEHGGPDCRPLGPEHFAQLERLYADGHETGEAPDFFSRRQVEGGVFCGVREGDALVAAAGTHLFSTRLGIGAVGNVYVRRDRRGRGLGRAVTHTVTAELLRRGLRTVALNVRQDNAAAIRVYESLGYRRYCPFYEGRAFLK